MARRLQSEPLNQQPDRLLIFGNSGAGKSTLATALSAAHKLAHLDLDTLAWTATTPPERKPLETSAAAMHRFMSENRRWVIEGCYSDLLEIAAPYASRAIFLDLPIEDCVGNARSRPWEPHKYPSKEAQDANLEMLLGWIADYSDRTDTFSKISHETFFQRFAGSKQRIVSNLNIGAAPLL